MRISVKVKTKSSQKKLLRNPDGSYTAFLNTAPVKGKANRSLIELLAGEFNVSLSSIRIVKGATSRNKIVEIGS